MSLIALGRATFDDLFAPVAGKNEWGTDTLTRKLSGARSGLAAFIASLAQGQVYGTNFYLQTWEPDESPEVATVTLNYKVFLTGGTPEPDIQTEIAPASGSISKSYIAFNNGAGIVIRHRPLWNSQFFTGQAEDFPILDTIIGYQDVYVTGGVREFTYDAIQTVYRYIKQGKPDRPQYYTVDIPRIPVIKRSRVSLSNGEVYGDNRPIGLELDPIVVNRVVGFTSRHIIGSPWWECQDVVRRELADEDSESDTAENFGGDEE